MNDFAQPDACFDEMVERRHTDSLKYDFALERGKPADILPLWVADMDFRTPPCVIEALVEKSRHGIFGYSESGQDYFEILRAWFAERFDWVVQPEWLVKTPGVVFGIHAAIRALTEPGNAILIQQPVYYPFAESILVNDRQLVVNELVYAQGRYQIDFADFEAKIIARQVKVFILCNPHNPVGRVWTAAELIRLGDLCLKHQVLVIADEIHADFVYPGHRHLVFANLKPEFADQAIICTAPTKTFNLAGLQISNLFITDAGIRAKIKQEINRCGYSQLNIMGLTACKAAYAGGSTWLESLKIYLQANLAWLRSYLTENLPAVKLVEPEGTYLVWLDFSELGLTQKQLDDLIVYQAGLWLDSGTIFGVGGRGFQRINIACPRAVLQKAVNQLQLACLQKLRPFNDD